jgi:hypothetical protein
MPFNRLASTSIGLVVAIAAARPLAAQEASSLQGEHVRVRLAPPPEDSYARTRFAGTLVRLDGDSVVLQDGRRRRAFERRRLERLDVRERRHSRTAGALSYGIPAAVIGAFVGAITATRVDDADVCALSVGGGCGTTDPLPAKETALALSVGSGVLGAWYGATAGRWGWARRDVAAGRVGLHGSGRGIGLSIAFGGR